MTHQPRRIRAMEAANRVSAAQNDPTTAIAIICRYAVAFIWWYQGLYCKLLGGQPHQADVAASAFSLQRDNGYIVLIAIGLFETGLGCLVAWSRPTKALASIQTGLLVAMNSIGLLLGHEWIPDPIEMVFNNCLLISVVWLLAELEHERRELNRKIPVQ